MKSVCGVSTNLGNGRKDNQDVYLHNSELNLYILCDGSSEGDGKWIATTTCREVEKFLLSHKNKVLGYNGKPNVILRREIENILDSAVQNTSKLIFEEIQKDSSKEKSITTIDLLLILADCFIVLHAGNSRIYHYRDQRLIQLTEDDTTFQSMVRTGSDPAKINKEYKKAILVGVGIQRVVPVKIQSYALLAEDVFLLCSDGLYEGLDSSAGKLSQALREVVKDNMEVAKICKSLTDMAFRAGIRDNISAIIVSIKRGANSEIKSELIRKQIDAVRKIPVFNEVANNEVDLLKLHNIFQYKKFKRGQTIFSQGDLSDSMYIILDGTVSLIVNGSQLRQTRTRGDIVGEMGVFTLELRSATVIATVDSELISVSRKELEALILKNSSLGLKIYRGVISELAKKIREKVENCY